MPTSWLLNYLSLVIKDIFKCGTSTHECFKETLDAMTSIQCRGRRTADKISNPKRQAIHIKNSTQKTTQPDRPKTSQTPVIIDRSL